jgi:hypothetical protein
VRRSDFSRLIARTPSVWCNVHRHFEAASMGVGIKWCASEAIRHVGARDAICWVVRAAHNAFVDRMAMMVAALVIRHLSAPFFVDARQNAVAAQPRFNFAARFASHLARPASYLNPRASWAPGARRQGRAG